MKKNCGFKYLQLAGKLQQLIIDGTYPTGSKLPSVRVLHQEQHISISTALQVYAYLEKQGWIEAREKSGYFVAYSRLQNRRELPPVSNPAPTAAEVQVNEQLSRLKNFTASTQVLSLVGPAPDSAVLPAGKLRKALSAVARTYDDSYIPYGDIRGYEPLRQQISRLSLNWGRAISPADILVTNGALEAATLCLRAVAKPGDTVAIESPTFFGLLLAIENLGLKALEIPTDPVTGIQIDKLEEAFQQKKVQACLLVPNFSNPLGSCMPDPEKERLAKMLARYQVPLIEDDVYGDLHFSPDRPKTIKSYDQEGWVLYCSSFSKIIAPGLRLGWIIGGRYQERISQIKFMNSAATSVLTQMVVHRFMEQQRIDLHLKNLRQTLNLQLMQLTKGIQEYFPKDTRLTQPNGGISLWVELPPKVDTWKLFEQAAAEKIVITPGPLYSSQQRYSNCLRLSNASPWTDEIEWGIATLGKLINTQL